MKKTKYKNELDNIKKQIINEIGDIIRINIQKYSINGSVIYNNQKCFFKIVDDETFIKEINGYFVCYGILPIKKILLIKRLINGMYIILYDYDETISDNLGLLNDVFVSNDKSKIISKNNIVAMDNVLSVYENIYSKTIKYHNQCPNNIFFKDRINSRLKKWYSNLLNNNIDITINNLFTISINKILNETIDYFNNFNHKEVCALTQGDPNTLNISIKPCFFDLVTAGYNSIISELAITIMSTLIYDNYFCPQYHPNSYGTHVDAIKNYSIFKPNISFEKKKEKIIINSNIKTSSIRKKYIFDYIDILKKNNIVIDSNIKYYIVMRLMCVFNINSMKEDDYYYSLFLTGYFYKNISDDFYDSITKIINEMEEI